MTDPEIKPSGNKLGPAGCLLLVPMVLAFVALAAHHLRSAEWGLALMWLSAPLLLRVHKRWAAAALTLLLLIGAAVWSATAWEIYQTRLALNQPWLRMALIMAAVALFTLAGSLAFLTQTMRARQKTTGPFASVITAMVLTAALLTVVHLKVSIRPLILDRFLTGGGWLEVLWLSIYAGWLTEKMLEPGGAFRWRPRLWTFFSALFFLQLALGLIGFETFLMTGNLHLPVPALIVAGPVYRGHGFFMLILFSVTILLAGPAWCSHLYY